MVDYWEYETHMKETTLNLISNRYTRVKEGKVQIGFFRCGRGKHDGKGDNKVKRKLFFF